MKYKNTKLQETYDNPKTLRRELYRHGKLIYSWSQEDVARICKEDRLARPWGAYSSRPMGIKEHT